jgi:hypothetical protein
MKNKAVKQMKSAESHPNSETESDVTQSEVDLQEQIRCRAYELYEQRGKEAGHAIDDWLQAETEMTAGTTKAAA